MTELLQVVGVVLGSSAIALIAYFLFGLFRGRVSAASLSALGFGGLVLIDVSRHLLLDPRGLELLYGERVVLRGTIIVVLSGLIMAAAYVTTAKVKPVGASRQVVPRSLSRLNHELPTRRMLRRSVVLSGVLLAVSLVFSIPAGYQSLAIGGALGATMTTCLLAIVSGRPWLGLVCIVGVTAGFIFADLSSRRAAVALLIPLIAVVVSYMRSKPLARPFSVMAITGLLVLAFLALNVMRAGHNFGEGYVEGDIVGNTTHYVTELTSINTFENTLFVIAEFPETWEYLKGESYVSVLAGPIPRSYWPDKPVGLAAPLGLMRRFGVAEFDSELWSSGGQFSLSPGLVGEGYANGGLLGVLIVSSVVGALGALFDRRWRQSINPMRYLPYLMFSTFFLLVHRGDFYTAITYPLFMGLGSLCVVLVLQRQTSRFGKPRHLHVTSYR